MSDASSAPAFVVELYKNLKLGLAFDHQFPNANEPQPKRKFPADRKTQRMCEALSVVFFYQVEESLLFLQRFNSK
ncbi:hypothetical protein HUU40_08875 [candidate division KSB1 bacterium]|nr:hypothetical protein [candidate division KSB1 bacterium]